MKPVKEIRFHATHADLSNIKRIKQFRPNWTDQEIISEGLRLLRMRCEDESTLPTTPQSAQEDITELFG
ncbi:MAG: hypothetical protein KKD77_24285 [Gammaproteobacteria bacterium]|nr:hypothetical protein [Gammaproteobacteria bacterium]